MKKPARSILFILSILFLFTAACGSDSDDNGTVIVDEDTGIHDATDNTPTPNDTDQNPNDTDPTPNDTEETEDTDTPGPITLSVLLASEISLHNGEAPAAGSRFALIEIDLKNGKHNEPISASYERFSLETKNGLLISPSPKSSTTTPACSSQINLTADTNYTCKLLFEIPNDLSPDSLHYASADDRKASTSVVFFPIITPLPQIAVTKYYGCLLSSEHDLNCWGDDIFEIFKKTPPGKFTQISLNESYACALQENAQIACWGTEANPELLAPPSGTFTQVAVAIQHSCAVRTNGKIACWGNNESGQIDDVPDNSNETFTQVVSTIDASCALTSDKTVRCWGDATSTQNTPTTQKFIQITAGIGYFCGLKPDGKTTCWGSTPNKSFTDHAFSQIATHHLTLCGIKLSNGHLSCKGTENTHGQLDVPDLAVDKVAVGEQHTCFIRSNDKKVACHGNTAFNVLDVPEF